MRITLLTCLLFLTTILNAQVQIDAIVTTDETCFGANDGTITITASLGTPPYMYDVNGMVQSSNVFTGMACGAYNVIVTDATPTTAFGTASINCATALTYSISTTDATMYGFCDGTADVTITGGTPPYTITYYDAVPNMIQSGASTSISGLCAGAYTVEVTDANGCTSTGPGGIGPNSFVITEPPCMMFSSYASTDVLCNGDCDGSVTLVTTGGMAPYMVSGPFPGSPMTYTSMANLNGFCAGTYTLSVNDVMGCFETIVVTINEPTLIAGSVSTVDESSAGACDGSATVTASGGTPPYTFNWYTCAGVGIGNTATTATGLCAGDYYCEITDGNGCQVNTACATVNSGAPPCAMVSTHFVTSPTCFGNCDGEITIVTTGGTMPYMVTGPFAGSPMTYTSTAIIPGMCAGTYTLTIDDAGGCTEFMVVNITEPTPVVQNNTITDESSAGACDGTITVTGGGGNPPYVYSIDCGVTFQSGPFTGLCAGTYQVMAMDANGCFTTCESVNVNSGTPPCTMVSAYTVTEPTCAGTCDGSLFITTTGGTPPYMVNDPVTGAPTTYTSAHMFTGLCAGAYTLLVQDAGGCTEAIVVIVTEPAPLVLNAVVTDESSAGACDGTITVTGTGGTGGLMYSNDCGATFQPTPVFSGLCAGPYGLMIIDANGCTSSCDTYVVNTGTPPCTMVSTVTTTDVSCFGACDGSIFLNTTGGTMPYIVNDPITGAPFTYTSVAGFNSLCAGTYTLLVQDAGGCSESIVFTINEPTAVFQTYTSSNETSAGACDGNITVTGGGGVSPYQYSIDCGLTYQAGPFTGLCAGVYNVMTMDANGCTTGCETVTIGSGGCTIVSNATTIPATCFGACDGTIMIFSTGGSPIYTVTDPMGGPDVSYSSTGTLTGICAGTYTLMVTDALGCTEFVVVTMTEPALLSQTYTSSNETSAGACDGSITVTGIGGTAGYSYSIDCGVTFQTGPFTGLCAGVYNVMTMDVNGCTTGCEAVTIGTTGCSMISNVTSTGETCFGACDGIITIVTTGGTPPYIVIDPTTGASLTYTSIITIPNVCPGSYTLTISDAAACNEVQVVTVTGPPAITTTASTVSHPTSIGGCDGVATGAATGGTGAFTYDWIDCNTGLSIGQFVPTASGLCAGSYAIVAIDGNGCTDTSACVDVTDPVSVIENQNSFSFELYPNPTSDLINIKWAKAEDVTIKFRDILGKVIFVSSVSDQSSVQFNLADLTVRNGVYLVQISNGKFSQTSRLIYSE